MPMNNYNKVPTSGRWSTKNPKYSQILDLVGVDKKLSDDLNKSSDKSNRDPTKGEQSYTSDLSP